MGSPDWNVSMVDIHLRKLQWVHYPGHARVKGNDWADRLAGKEPSQMAWFSEDLKWWGAWNTTCGHKTKDITPSIAWGREARKEEAFDWRSPLRTREDHRSSDEHSVAVFQRRRSGNFLETGYSERVDTILNWNDIFRNDLSCRYQNAWKLLS